jgi:TPR repeat protein
MYDYGEGTEEDNPTALKWYTQAAQKGQLYAQYYLGFIPLW